ncbi:MAG: hypothetical protein J5502_05540 [Prevotella sp.]|nr:hypothetical protein [Prevotella sp.]
MFIVLYIKPTKGYFHACKKVEGGLQKGREVFSKSFTTFRKSFFDKASMAMPTQVKIYVK